MRTPKINVLGTGSYGSLIAAIACGASEDNAASWGRYDSKTADELYGNVHFMGVNTEHPTLQAHQNALPAFEIVKAGSGGGAKSYAEAKTATLAEFSKSDSAVTKRLGESDINIITTTLGGHSGVILACQAIEYSLDRHKLTIPIFVFPHRRDGTQPKNRVMADQIREQIRQYGIPYFEMPMAAVYRDEVTNKKSELVKFDRQAGFIVSTFIIALANFGYGLDGSRFRPLISGSRRLVYFRDEIPLKQLSGSSQDFYNRTWSNSYFEEQEKEQVEGVIRVFQTVNPGKYEGKINDLFGELDENAAKSAPDHFPDIYSVHASGSDDSVLTVTSIRFLAADPTVNVERIYDFFDADVQESAPSLSLAAVNEERYKNMKDFPTLADWVKAFKAQNPLATDPEAQPIDAILTEEQVKLNLSLLAEIGDFGKALPRRWHNQLKGIAKDSYKLTRFLVRNDEGKEGYLSRDLNSEELESILQWRAFLTGEHSLEVETRIQLAKAFSNGFLLTLEVLEDPSAPAVAATSDNGNGTAGHGADAKESSVRRFLKGVLKETKSDFTRLGLMK